jgi:hypothetical protein
MPGRERVALLDCVVVVPLRTHAPNAKTDGRSERPLSALRALFFGWADGGSPNGRECCHVCCRVGSRRDTVASGAYGGGRVPGRLVRADR